MGFGLVEGGGGGSDQSATTYQLDPDPFPNLETNETLIRAKMVITAPAVNPVDAAETCALYIKPTHAPGGTVDFANGIYIEQTYDQGWTSGAGLKVIHKGAGDAVYVAMLGDNVATGAADDEPASGGGGTGGGFGYEAAAFRDRQSMYIATFQGLGLAGGPFPESTIDQSNCVGYQVLVHDDTTDPVTAGWSPFALNTAAFYANNCPSNAFVCRVSEYANVGFTQFKVMDHNQRPHWGVFGDGQQHMYGAEATSGAQNQQSPPFLLRGYYWDGAAEQPIQAQLTCGVADAPSATALLRIDVGVPSSEVLIAQFMEDLGTGNSGVDFQDNDIQAVDKITFTTSGAGLDLQRAPITTCGSITAYDADNPDILNFYNMTLLGTTIRLAQARTITAYTDAGNNGDLAYDDNYAYRYCTTRWKRIAWDAATW